MLIETVEDLRNTFPSNYNLYYPQGSEGSGGCFDLYIRILRDPASRIYAGKKKFELRKYVPRHTGLVFLFETGGTNAVTGCFLFERFLVDSVENLWSRVGTRATSREKFSRYFKNKKVGVALEISDFEKFTQAIPLQALYHGFQGFPKVPHPYVYLYTPVGGALSSFLRSHARAIVKRNELD